jgi:hypothetical protein
MFGAITSLMRGHELVPNTRIIGSTTLRRLFVWYLFVGSIVIALQLAAPLAESGDGRVLAPQLSGSMGYSITEPPFIPPWLDASLAMLGACLLAIPLGFVYIRTRTRTKYDESLVNTVIMLPPLVTSILIVVQNSLALAFSLAGIVAAVQFRNNLKDSRDAVYILAAVGIGFAAGVYALDVAMVVSFGFACLELLTWKANLARDHDRVMSTLCGPTGEVEATGAGDQTRIDPSSNGNGHNGAMPRFHPDDELVDQPKPPKEATMRVYVSDIDDGRAMSEAVLTRMTKRWKLLRTNGGGGSQLVLDYEVRLRKRYPAEKVVNALYKEGSPFVVAAEDASHAS